MDAYRIIISDLAKQDMRNTAAHIANEFQNIKDWNFDIDYDKRSFSIGPSEEQQRKAMKVLVIIGAVITLIILCRKLCCRKK